jgi:hypothetical protein
MSRFINKLFGRSSAPRAARPRPTTRLQLEQLDERVLLSNTGTISSVWARPDIGQVVYSIGADKNLYESINGGYSHRIDNGYCDLQVSAGTDQYGNSVAYVLNTYGSLWGLKTTFDNNGIPYCYYMQKFADNVVYDPRNWWSSFSAAMGTGYNSGARGGVYYISHREDFYSNFDRNPQLLSSAGVDYQISAGTDWFGYNVNYVLNGVDHNIYERHANGAWSKIDLSGYGYDGQVMQIAGSVNNIIYMLVDPYGGSGAPYNHEIDTLGLTSTTVEVTTGIAMMWNGNELTEVSYWWGNSPHNQYVMQISAGTDPWGYSTLDYIVTTHGYTDSNWNYHPSSGDFYQYDTINGATYILASNVREVCGGQRGFDFFKDTNESLYEVDPGWSVWQIGDRLASWGENGWQW